MLVYPGDEKDSLCGLKSKVPLSLWYIDSYLRHFQLQDSHDPRDLCSVIIIIHIQDLGFRPKPLQPTYAGLGERNGTVSGLVRTQDCRKFLTAIAPLESL